MKNHTDCKRQFIHLSRAWYGDVNLRFGEVIDEITVGYYHKEGGTTGEFSIRWTELGGKSVPMLISFDDSWHALWKFSDLLERMAGMDGSAPNPIEICDVLVSLGVEDITPEQSPYGDSKKEGRRLFRKPDTSTDSCR